MAQWVNVLAVLLQGTWGWFPALTSQFTTACNSIFRTPSTLFSPLWALRAHGAYICRQNMQMQKSNKYFKEGDLN